MLEKEETDERYDMTFLIGILYFGPDYKIIFLFLCLNIFPLKAELVFCTQPLTELLLYLNV